MSLSPGTRLGPYQVTAPLGEGGMGEVYRAADSNLKRSVAIKVLPASVAGDTDRLARFQREAEVLAALNHPNIAQIFGLEKTPDFTALVMELVEGQDLSQMIAAAKATSHGPGGLPLADALAISRQIADALEAAHEQGIIHRDLKPANIKVRPDGTVKVLDFGLAKAMDPAAASSPGLSMFPTITTPAPEQGRGLTQMGMILGTAAYMAPEQARGKMVDRRADIWSFGVVLYEMLSGRRAFEGDDISITLASVLKEDPNWDALPAGLPPSIERLLRRCLDKDPKRRLQAIGEARVAIEESVAGPGPVAAEAVKTEPLQSSGFVWKIATGVLAAAVVALGVVAFVHFREQTPATELVRFQVPAPEESEARWPTVSPDGRQVAFVTLVGSRQVWVHSLEASVSRPLPGTERTVDDLIWSPDSRYLAFLTDGKLQKVAVAGGLPQPIADIPGIFRGGAWGREGVIVFGGDQGLMQVPENGGTPAVLLPIDPSRKDDAIGMPRFLADGRHFVYARRSSDPAGAEIYLGSLDRAQAPKRLDATGMVFGYATSPDPRLLYLVLGRPGSLWAQAFDTRRLEITGEAMRIAAAVDASQTPLASVSTTGGLAYESAGAPGKFQLTWFDRTGKTLGVEWEAGVLQAPNLSRDGKRVAIERADSGNADVWVIDLSRGTATRVTSDPSHDIRPVLSPDGTRVAFARGGSIYQKTASGTGEEERLGDGEPTDWSPDGRFISFIRDGDLWAMPLSGDRTPVLLAGGRFNERRGRFSPDGKWVAYESDSSGRFEIYLQSFPQTTDQVQMISVNGGDSAYWRGDGKELFFRALDDRIMSVDITPGPPPDLGVPRAVFHLPADVNNGRFVVTPDGQRFLAPIEVQKSKPPVMMMMLNWLETLKSNSAKGQ